MSGAMSARGGEFATAPRSKAAAYASFILDQHAKGRSAAVIARMSQCSEADVRAILPAPPVEITGLTPMTREQVRHRYIEMRRASRSKRATAIPERIKDALERMCAEEKVTLAQLLDDRDTPRIIDARHRAYWILHRLHGCSLPKAGGYMGGRHHSSVLTGLRKYEQRCADLAAILREPENPQYSQVANRAEPTNKGSVAA